MGHHNRHFANDHFAQTGIWGSPTSVANFCEEDYAVTKFIAEFINSLTNLAYVYFALKSPGHRRGVSRTFGRMDSLSVTLLLVGVTSTAFHATLHQIPQLADDLSMLLLAGALLQKLYCVGRAHLVARLVTGSIWVLTLIISTIYVRSGNILIHMWTFGIMVALIGLRLLYLIHYKPWPKQEKASLVAQFWNGAVYCLVAFAVWNIDLEMCHQIRALRREIRLPWSWLFEFHGWWHILTAVGAAKYIELARSLCDSDIRGQRRNGRELLSNRRLPQNTVFAFLRRTLCQGMTEKSKADLERIGAAR